MENKNSAAMKAAEQQTESTKVKRTDEEKLQELYAKRDKLLKRLADVKAQEKSLDKRIAALNEKIKEIERTRLLNMCKERNWTPSARAAGISLCTCIAFAVYSTKCRTLVGRAPSGNGVGGEALFKGIMTSLNIFPPRI